MFSRKCSPFAQSQMKLCDQVWNERRMYQMHSSQKAATRIKLMKLLKEDAKFCTVKTSLNLLVYHNLELHRYHQIFVTICWTGYRANCWSKQTKQKSKKKLKMLSIEKLKMKEVLKLQEFNKWKQKIQQVTVQGSYGQGKSRWKQPFLTWSRKVREYQRNCFKGQGHSLNGFFFVGKLIIIECW